jgi:2-oxoglutarate dehydrogenase E2 component (dihydrolipoamide succinyltransferase)
MDTLTMSIPVILPALGESVTEGTVVRWLKQVGDTIAVDEPLLEVTTDKVDTEIPSPSAGVLLEISVAEDEIVEVGALDKRLWKIAGSPGVAEDEIVEVGAQLAVIGAASSTLASASASVDPPGVQAVPAVDLTGPPPSTRKQRWGRIASTDNGGYLSPLVRTMAAEHGVELASIKGSGRGGRIRKQDLVALIEARKPPEALMPAAPTAPSAPSASAGAPSPAALRGTTKKMSRLRQVIATRMVESLQTSAQLTQVMEVDMTRVARLRDRVRADFLAREGVKLTYLPFFAKAAIDALKQHPKLNARIDASAGEVTYLDYANIAFAVDTERGLLTPVVHNAGDLSIAGLARRVADLSERTRSNMITPDDLAGGTFTITNLGSFGALFDTPIISQPQVAILGPGAVVKRPVVIDDPDLGQAITVRQMVYVALSYDHRLVDGADAGRFLSDVKKRLEGAQFNV